MASESSDYTVSSVFLGGGTPSILNERLVADILDHIRSLYTLSEDAEITVECNPGSTMRHKFAAYKKAGVNRLSIGLQSADNTELRMLGRIHTFEEFLKSYQAARMEGFDNINVDLINCLPMQTAKTWKKTLKTVLMLRPEHVSVYNLIIEDGTPFCEMFKSGLLTMPSEEVQEEIDRFTKDYLAQMGYQRYEISNWARPGYSCRHNEGYWTGVPYLGFGPGAASYFEKRRFKNTMSYPVYMRTNFADRSEAEAIRSVQALSEAEQMEEFMFLGLRRIEGISMVRFQELFGKQIDDVYREPIRRAAEQGLLERDGYHLRLTERGLDVSNVVLSEFLLST